MRVKGGKVSRRRRKKVLERASGYYSSGSRLFSYAKERNDRGLAYAYRDRKQKKREFRTLWIARISAAAKINGVSYSKFMGAVIKSGLQFDRKVLADIALFEPKAFAAIVQQVMPKA
ncbi:MAG: 50S ribosomal protein L20 [Bdellovibrionales bacterium]|nr:50S ribosomal protein L20 [Bdellovibrionales bacterium]